MEGKRQTRKAALKTLESQDTLKMSCYSFNPTLFNEKTKIISKIKTINLTAYMVEQTIVSLHYSFGDDIGKSFCCLLFSIKQVAHVMVFALQN